MASQSDALIIGGGLTGCGVAYHLAKAGLSVDLVEAGQINNGASGQNAGSLHFQFERRFFEHGTEAAGQASASIALNRMAIDEWSSLGQELDADLELTMLGGLMVAESAEERALLELKCEFEAKWDLPTRIIGGDAAREMVPGLSRTIIAASFLASEGHANPRLVAPAFARRAADHGARFVLDHQVRTISRTTSGYAVEVDGSDGVKRFTTRRIVIAAGAATAKIGALANLHLPVFPVGLTMAITERLQPRFPYLIQHVGKRLSMKQGRSGNILIGGGWPSMLVHDEAGNFNPLARPRLKLESLKGSLATAAATMPEIATETLLRTWTGIATLTADQLPIVGEVPRSPGIHVVAGGSGFTLGPTFARLLAKEVIKGEKDSHIAPFSPKRFEHLNGYMG